MYFSFEMQMGEIFKGFKEKLLHPPGGKKYCIYSNVSDSLVLGS